MKIYLANPRGFCAGVERAIRIVERALELYGAPVYVRHEIVHNRHVVEGLKQKGVIFVEELREVPSDAVVILSAHGVSRKVKAEGEGRGFELIDATCPLVTKVHREAKGHESGERELILIGHAGHPEVEGTMGQVDGRMHLISSVEDVERLVVKDPEKVAFVTQTTLSIDETRAVVEALHRRFPAIKGPKKENTCYATQNRQDAVKEIIDHVDLLLVVGSKNSSNSNRLRELGERHGVRSYLIASAREIQPEWLEGCTAIGLTAGASAPEFLVKEVLGSLTRRDSGTEVDEVVVTTENVRFAVPI